MLIISKQDKGRGSLYQSERIEMSQVNATEIKEVYCLQKDGEKIINTVKISKRPIIMSIMRTHFPK